MGVYKASKVCGVMMRNVVGALQRRMRGPRRGYIPVSVGAESEEAKRFMVRARALCDADFLELLSESAEEYGFRNEGIIRIRCETKVFEQRIGCSLILKGTKLLKEC